MILFLLSIALIVCSVMVLFNFIRVVWWLLVLMGAVILYLLSLVVGV